MTRFVECTGVGQVIADSINVVGAVGIACITGDDAAPERPHCNAHKRYWYKVRQPLAQADATWLARLVSRREKPDAFMNALHRQPGGDLIACADEKTAL